MPSAEHTKANPTSDHELGNAADLTHDPGNGVDCNVIADEIKTDSRVKYVIWNRKIYKSRQPGKGWQKYTGTNPHTKHCHISIHSYARDDISDWPIGALGTAAAEAIKEVRPTLRRGDRGPEVELLQVRLGVNSDGRFGPKTEKALKEFQAKAGLEVNGVAGAKTWAKLEGK
jgi:hypothetical protein